MGLPLGLPFEKTVCKAPFYAVFQGVPWVRVPPSAVINLRRTVGFFMLIFRKAGN